MSADCSGAASPDRILDLAVPGSPFMATAAPDGCTVFATLHTDSGDALAVLDLSTSSVKRVVRHRAAAGAVVVSSDGRLVVVAHEDEIAFFDGGALTREDNPPLLGTIHDARAHGFRPQGVFTPDDRYLLLVSEGAGVITVVSMAGPAQGDYGPEAVVGHIPVGAAPVGLRLSPDGRFLYSTSQGAGRLFDWPRICRSQRPDAPPYPTNKAGLVLVHELDRVIRNPETAPIGAAEAGCNTNRLALSPDGEVLYVTVRGQDEVRAFDTRALRSDPEKALLGTASVGRAPVGLVLVDDGQYVVVANSARFDSGARPQHLSVVSAETLIEGGGKVVNTISVGRFPRELALTPDRRSLILTNYDSRSVQLIPVEMVRPQ